MKFLAIDPGKHAIGLSVWQDEKLIHVDYFTRTSMYDLGLSLAAYAADLVVCEVPQLYRIELQSGDQNDMIEVALVAGVCLAAAPESVPVKPRSWKGTVPKDVHNRRVMNLLSPAERACVEAVKPASKRHNAIDAVGLGLWRLGRLVR